MFYRYFTNVPCDTIAITNTNTLANCNEQEGKIACKTVKHLKDIFTRICYHGKANAEPGDTQKPWKNNVFNFQKMLWLINYLPHITSKTFMIIVLINSLITQKGWLLVTSTKCKWQILPISNVLPTFERKEPEKMQTSLSYLAGCTNFSISCAWVQ